MTINEVILDLETKKLFDDIGDRDPGKLGLSIISIYQRTLDKNLTERSGRMLSFWEKDLDGLWPHLFSADRIIGFNSISFDIPVLQSYTNHNLSKLPNFDILVQVKQILGYRIGLDDLAQATLGVTKTDVGFNAVKYYYQGDQKSLQKLKNYCEADVLITKKLYDYALNKQKLKFISRQTGKITPLKINFSYPENFLTIFQKKLF
ncbi:MAG: ribonuclease H-like domain-containing protein [Candidatus Shapirobacteria bacterium]|nr:ribonuclease H-like domain-containing protein [Candidatus Shapirobacteria bacterium]